MGTVILEATTIGARWGAIGTSAILHAGVAIAVVAAGHSADGRTTSAPRLVEAAVVEIAAPEIAQEALPERAESHAGAPRTHTHPYPVPNDHDATPHDPSLVHTPLASPTPHHDDAHEAAEAPAVATAPESAPLRFTITVGAAAIAPGGASAQTGTAQHAVDAIVLPESAADTPARFLGGDDPLYPPAAAAAGIETDVPLEIVIDSLGRVASVRVVKAVGYGLDDAAVRSVRTYRFQSATHDGRPVAVRRAWNVTFRLR